LVAKLGGLSLTNAFLRSFPKLGCLRASIGLFLEVNGGGGVEGDLADSAVKGEDGIGSGKDRDHLTEEMNDLVIGPGVEARKTPREGQSGVERLGSKRAKVLNPSKSEGLEVMSISKPEWESQTTTTTASLTVTQGINDGSQDDTLETQEVWEAGRREIFQEINNTLREQKAVKADDAEVPEFLWFNHLVEDGPSEWKLGQQERLAWAMTVARVCMFRW
jgi:hypothetical protein